MADRIVVMNHGRIEQVGTPREVYETPATPFAADFVGKVNVLPGDRRRRRAMPRRRPVARLGAHGHRSRARRRSSTCAPRTSSSTANGAAPAGRQRARRAKVTKVEFLGAFCMVGLAADAADVPALIGQRAAARGRRRRPRARCRRGPDAAADGAARAHLGVDPPMAAPAAAISVPPAGTAVRPLVHWQDRLAQVAARCAAVRRSRCSCWGRCS